MTVGQSVKSKDSLCEFILAYPRYSSCESILIESIYTFFVVKSVCSALDSGWGSLVDWGICSGKDSSTKDSGYGCNQII